MRARGMAKARDIEGERDGKRDREGGTVRVGGRARARARARGCGLRTGHERGWQETRRDLEKKDSNTKIQPWECLQGHATVTPLCFDFQFFSLALALRPLPPLPHFKCESEGTFFIHAHAWAV